MANYEEWINTYGKGKKVNPEDKDNFFSKLTDLISAEHLLILWHIVTHPKCAASVFTATEAIIIVAVVAYVICPIDAIPDFIPIGGLLDDAALVAWAISTYSSALRDYKNKCM